MVATLGAIHSFTPILQPLQLYIVTFRMILLPLYSDMNSSIVMLSDLCMVLCGLHIQHRL